MIKHIYTIQKEDIGKKRIKNSPCPTCGHTNSQWLELQDVLGYIQPHDVGKKVYLSTSGSLHVENDQHLKRRGG